MRNELDEITNMEEMADAVVRIGEVALAFGRVNRITFHPDGTTPESDTDHTVMLGLLACSLAQVWYPGLSVGRIAQYCLVHDLPEVHAGDTPTLTQLSADETAAKKTREALAAMKLAADFRGTMPWVPWTISSYEDLATPVARLVKFLDKLMPKITHLLNGATTITAQGMTRAALVDRYAAQGRELDWLAAEFPEVEQLRVALVRMVLARIDEQGSDTDG